MDSYKKLSEELLKTDGIDPANIPDSERTMFRQLLDKHLNSGKSKQVLWRIIMKNKIIKFAAIFLIIIAFVIIAYDSYNSKSDIKVEIPKEISMDASSLNSMGRLTLAQQIARAPIIIRAKLMDYTETSTRWRITKVLHGKVTDDFVDVSYFPVSTESEKSPESMQSWWHRIEESKGKTLNTEEIWKEFSKIHSFWPTLGQEVILFLEKQDDKLYRYQGANYDVPPEHSLNEQEKLIQQVISSGAYKTAPIEDGRL